MSLKNKITPALLLLLPVTTVIWSVILNHISGPHFLSRSDPEYVYLLNGMNVSLLEFDRIGHVDHPGTPFQLLTGLFIRLIHAVSGTLPLIDDVISFPEKYLALSSFFLSLITGYLLYTISRIIYRPSRDLTGALIIPASFFFFSIILDLPSRYIPDRLLLIDLLLFSIVCIKYLYQGYDTRRFAIFSGILMAAGLVTKINFLPFLIFPLFVIPGMRNKLVYSVSLVLSSVILFLPVFDKFDYFWTFAVQITTHDSLYGGGNEQVLNPESFFQNLGFIIRDNPAFLFILFLAMAIVLFILFKPGAGKTRKQELLFFTGFLAVAALSFLVVAKHYKNYYMIPSLGISGLALYSAWIFSKKFRVGKYALFVLIPAGIAFFVHVLMIVIPAYQYRADTLRQDLLTHAFVRDHVPAGDYFFIEPTWMPGPMITNGLVYGCSYVANRPYFYNDYEKVYPTVITYEGKGAPLKYFRMIDASNECILKSGHAIYVLDTPGRNAPQLLHYLDSCALQYSIRLNVDTVFLNVQTNTGILRVTNTSGWKTKTAVRCGFEQEKDGIMRSDDGKTELYGDYQLTRRNPAGGTYALKLDGDMNRTPMYAFKGVKKGDFFQATIKRKRRPAATPGMLVAEYNGAENGFVSLKEDSRLSGISSDWELVRINFSVEDQPVDSMIMCYYKYFGEEEHVLDDFTASHYEKTMNRDVISQTIPVTGQEANEEEQ